MLFLVVYFQFLLLIQPIVIILARLHHTCQLNSLLKIVLAEKLFHILQKFILGEDDQI